MRFFPNDPAAHSTLPWSFDDPVDMEILIPEIVQLLRVNQPFPPEFVPTGTVDIIASDIAGLLANHGFSKESSDQHARLRYANDPEKCNKLILIFDTVRGTLIAHGDLRMV